MTTLKLDGLTRGINYKVKCK